MLTIEKIRRRQPAAVDDALIRALAIDGVTTVAGYRVYFRNEREQSNRTMGGASNLLLPASGAC